MGREEPACENSMDELAGEENPRRSLRKKKVKCILYFFSDGTTLLYKDVCMIHFVDGNCASNVKKGDECVVLHADIEERVYIVAVGGTDYELDEEEDEFWAFNPIVNQPVSTQQNTASPRNRIGRRRNTPPERETPSGVRVSALPNIHSASNDTGFSASCVSQTKNSSIPRPRGRPPASNAIGNPAEASQIPWIHNQNDASGASSDGARSGGSHTGTIYRPSHYNNPANLNRNDRPAEMFGLQSSARVQTPVAANGKTSFQPRRIIPFQQPPLQSHRDLPPPAVVQNTFDPPTGPNGSPEGQTWPLVGQTNALSERQTQPHGGQANISPVNQVRPHAGQADESPERQARPPSAQANITPPYQTLPTAGQENIVRGNGSTSNQVMQVGNTNHANNQHYVELVAGSGVRISRSDRNIALSRYRNRPDCMRRYLYRRLFPKDYIISHSALGCRGKPPADQNVIATVETFVRKVNQTAQELGNPIRAYNDTAGAVKKHIIWTTGEKYHYPRPQREPNARGRGRPPKNAPKDNDTVNLRNENLRLIAQTDDLQHRVQELEIELQRLTFENGDLQQKLQQLEIQIQQINLHAKSASTSQSQVERQALLPVNTTHQPSAIIPVLAVQERVAPDVSLSGARAIPVYNNPSVHTNFLNQGSSTEQSPVMQQHSKPSSLAFSNSGDTVMSGSVDVEMVLIPTNTNTNSSNSACVPKNPSIYRSWD